MNRATTRLEALPDDHADRAAHRAGRSPWLASAKLKLVDGCNLRCFMCDYWHKRRDGELTTDEVFAVLADLAALECQKVHLTGGELFLRKDAVDIVKEATRLGMRVNLTTNGTRLPKERIKELLRIPVRGITISIDSPVARIHDQVRGREGAWRQSTKTIQRLLKHRRAKNRIRVNTVVSRRNYRSLVEMPGWLKEHPIDAWLLIPMEKWVGDEAVMTPEDIRYYNARIAPILEECVDVPGFDPWIYGRTEDDVQSSAEQRYALGYYKAHRCYVPWFHTLIGPSGDVYPCCGTHRRMKPLGNVRDMPLRQIFDASPYVQLRRKMLDERMDACHHCDDFLKENRALEDLF